LTFWDFFQDNTSLAADLVFIVGKSDSPKVEKNDDRTLVAIAPLLLRCFARSLKIFKILLKIIYYTIIYII
jgi:hypothetical protein